MNNAQDVPKEGATDEETTSEFMLMVVCIALVVAITSFLTFGLN